MNSQLYKSKRLNKYANCLEVYTIDRIPKVYLVYEFCFTLRRDLSRILVAECTAVMSDQ